MAEAKPSSPVNCPSCGAKNNPSGRGARCASCGASMDPLAPGAQSDIVGKRKSGFNLLWCGIALAVQCVLTAAIIIGLPMVVSLLDFEGSNGMTMAVPVWFTGGILLGLVAPARTYMEPLVASFLVQIPTVYFLWHGQTVRTMPLFMYIVLGLIGVLFSAVGAYLGERIQLGPPPKTAE